MEGSKIERYMSLGDACSYNDMFGKIYWYSKAARLGNTEAIEFCVQQLGETWEQARLHEYVDISEIPKLELLKGLWENQSDDYEGPDHEPQFDIGWGETIVEKAGYIDFFDGRPIKCDLSQRSVNPAHYNLWAGEGTFQSVVNSIKEQ
jgi:hypothetical protein